MKKQSDVFLPAFPQPKWKMVQVRKAFIICCMEWQSEGFVSGGASQEKNGCYKLVPFIKLLFF